MTSPNREELIDAIESAEQVIWAESVPNDGTYEYTLTGDCHGTVWAYLRREPAAEIMDGLWTHTREPGAWVKCTETEYLAALATDVDGGRDE